MKVLTSLFMMLTLLSIAHAQDETTLRAAIEAQLNAPKMRSTISSTLSEGKIYTTIVEYVAPDSYHMISKNGETILRETIISVGKTYERSGDGNWTLSPVDLSSTIASLRNTETLNQTSFSEFQPFADETLNGRACTVFSYTASYQGILSHQKIWIDKTGQLPLKLESSSEVSGVKTQSGILYDYDDSIQIATPQ